MINYTCQSFNHVWCPVLNIQARKRKHTVITPVAALTPASPNTAVAASVTRAVAAIFTTLHTTYRHEKLLWWRWKRWYSSIKRPNKEEYVVPISMVVRNRVTSLRSSLKTPFSDSFSANSRTFKMCIKSNQTSKN
jgi:hypothetical protein